MKKGYAPKGKPSFDPEASKYVKKGYGTKKKPNKKQMTQLVTKGK